MGLSRGDHACSYGGLERTSLMPRARPVVIEVNRPRWREFPATNVNLHGTSPWHPERHLYALLVAATITPTGQARGIFQSEPVLLVATSGNRRETIIKYRP